MAYRYRCKIAEMAESKALKQAVKLDGELKELINDGTGESKDSGRDGEA